MPCALLAAANTRKLPDGSWKNVLPPVHSTSYCVKRNAGGYAQPQTFHSWSRIAGYLHNPVKEELSTIQEVTPGGSNRNVELSHFRGSRVIHPNEVAAFCLGSQFPTLLPVRCMLDSGALWGAIYAA